MRRLLYLLPVLALSIFFSSCGNDDDQDLSGSLELVFKARYGDEPLVMLGEEYTYPDGTPIKFQLVNYYVTDIALLAPEENKETLVSEVELIDYAEFYDTATAENGVSITYDDLSPGTYEQIRLGIGLTPDLNGTQPSNYIAGHPLTDNFWSWARGYVFAKIEAVADLDGDGQFSDKLTYHIGADDLFTTLTVDQPIVIQKDSPLRLIFEIDMEQVLQRQGDYLDLNEAANTQDHTNNPDIYEWLWENLVDNLSLKN